MLLLQIAGAGCLIWATLPIFQDLADNPGEQISRQGSDYFMICVSILTMQSAYWYGYIRVPVPFVRPNVFLNHLIAFLARLSFIFGAALFSVVFFRHLPVLTVNFSIGWLVSQGVLLACALFALFCLALELERLASALARKPSP
ncbi:hypothetical protein [Methylobacterium sp. J-070]|uniref:hypothetical protein n=1 Tax=Methylobacterium sp. J-070 TaxID=2836650 RepID=UPI001FBB56EE|nr:hypothetical protein [Methylobacterium sp. J-070]MCJ2052506.1 hypothetical protein [Methylobacterium sp. J-070]